MLKRHEEPGYRFFHCAWAWKIWIQRTRWHVENRATPKAMGARKKKYRNRFADSPREPQAQQVPEPEEEVFEDAVE